MRLCAGVSVVVFAVAALLAPFKSSAQIVTVSGQKLSHCGHGNVICSGQQAYSLTEILSGALQIPIDPLVSSEIVVVNDTGAAITDLEFTVTTYQFLDSLAFCQIDATARSQFKTCTATVLDSGVSTNPFASVSVQFTYSAQNKKGIPDGDYFDISTLSFMPGSYLAGPPGDSGDPGINPGTGTASY